MSLRDQLAAHLALFGELGATGTSRDPMWRERPGEIAPQAPDAADRRVEGPVPEAAREAGPPAPAVETLAAIQADLGECTRCKLHQAGQIAPAIAAPTDDDLIIMSALLGLAGVVMNTLANVLLQNLRRIRQAAETQVQANRALGELNVSLETRVEERVRDLAAELMAEERRVVTA